MSMQNILFLNNLKFCNFLLYNDIVIKNNKEKGEIILEIINSNLDGIPHGHGGSFKKGISDGLLKVEDNTTIPNGHEESYRRGRVLGESLKSQVAAAVRQ
ncbi:hypothetical protein D6T70_06530 [Kurthia gibsonii]|uniref:hypothetical protein n=1 Tax=Kurthia gibsonii TaxID=33946 RepID=UPI00103440C2|nr:hypothetical protein [Kurthia gibsonii]RXH52489.1 hypothetical protein D6T70_06530 [Kurthia gibsonii]